MISVTLAQANEFVRRKNFLSSAKGDNPLQLVKDLGGLPGPWVTTPFLAAAARLENVTPEQLVDGLRRDQRLVKQPLMRNTPYIVLRDQHNWYLAATARQRTQDLNAGFRLWGVENNDQIEYLGPTILETVGDQTMSAEAIMESLPAGFVKELRQTTRGGRRKVTNNVALALDWLAATGSLQTMNTADDWRAETISYALPGRWYPNDPDLAPAPDEAAAQKMIVRRYLAAFGPATEADISFWTGFGKSETARATGALNQDTILTMVAGIPGMLFTLKEQADALTAVEVPAEPQIDILPAGDPLTTAHRASRSRYFSDQKLQRHIFSSSGAAKPAILVNSQIVGVWDWRPETDHDTIFWRLISSLDPIVEALIQAKFEQLATFINPSTILAREPS